MEIKFERAHDTQSGTFTTKILVPAGIAGHCSPINSMTRGFSDFGACSRFPVEKGERMSFEFLADGAFQVTLCTQDLSIIRAIEGIALSAFESALSFFNRRDRVRLDRKRLMSMWEPGEIAIPIPPEEVEKIPR